MVKIISIVCMVFVVATTTTITIAAAVVSDEVNFKRSATDYFGKLSSIDPAKNHHHDTTTTAAAKTTVNANDAIRDVFGENVRDEDGLKFDDYQRIYQWLKRFGYIKGESVNLLEN